jgi:hypothetical protein
MHSQQVPEILSLHNVLGQQCVDIVVFAISPPAHAIKGSLTRNAEHQFENERWYLIAGPA